MSLIGVAVTGSFAARGGALDPSFGKKGKVTTEFELPFVAADADAAALQPDGRIVAAGAAVSSESHRTAVARYMPDGRLDSSFAGDGTALYDFGGLAVTEALISPDGLIVLAGYRGDAASGLDVVVAALEPDGEVASLFAPDGARALDLAQSVLPATLHMFADGSMLLGGAIVSEPGSSGPLVVARLTPGAELDASFGDGGLAVADAGGFVEGGHLAVSDDGSIVISGRRTRQKGGSFVGEPAVARFDPAGTLDQSFANDGISARRIGGLAPGLNDGPVALQDDGRIVVLATADGSEGADAAAVRFRRDGRLDRAFGSGGIASADLGGYRGGAFDEGSDLAVDRKGRIVISAAVAETGSIEGSQFGIVRFKPGGGLDRDFSDNGRERTSFGGTDYPSDLLVQSNGRIVLVGSSTSGEISDDELSGREFALARYRAP